MSAKLLLVAAMPGVLAMPAMSRAQVLAPAEARAIAKDAYVYGFPLVDNYRILHSYFVDRSGPEFKAPWNRISNTAQAHTPEDKAIQAPNSDAPHSQLGLDLRAEPIVLSFPAVEKTRYYSAQFIDLYTFNFAYVGSRATGNGAGTYLVAGPRWKGEKPKGVKAVIRSETDFVLVLYRTQLFNPEDIEKLKQVQAGYKVQTLSSFLGKAAPAPAPAVDFIEPLGPEAERMSPAFFDVLNFVLQFCPTHPSEQALMARFARLGVGAGKRFDAKALSPELREAVEAGMDDAWDAFDKHKETRLDTGRESIADAFGTRAYLKNDYLRRMSGAALGIHGNSKEEAAWKAPPMQRVD